MLYRTARSTLLKICYAIFCSQFSYDLSSLSKKQNFQLTRKLAIMVSYELKTSPSSLFLLLLHHPFNNIKASPGCTHIRALHILFALPGIFFIQVSNSLLSGFIQIPFFPEAFSATLELASPYQLCYFCSVSIYNS